MDYWDSYMSIEEIDIFSSAGCRDDDECALNTDGCAQTCTNTTGSYQCGCNTGYTLNGNNHGCDDVNECVTGAYSCGSNEVCSNTTGSYDCVCDSGYSYQVGGAHTISGSYGSEYYSSSYYYSDAHDGDSSTYWSTNSTRHRVPTFVLIWALPNRSVR